LLLLQKHLSLAAECVHLNCFECRIEEIRYHDAEINQEQVEEREARQEDPLHRSFDGYEPDEKMEDDEEDCHNIVKLYFKVVGSKPFLKLLK